MADYAGGLLRAFAYDAFFASAPCWQQSRRPALRVEALQALRDCSDFHEHNSTTRAVNVAAALISMLSLETAMITQFGDESDTVFRHVMIASTGGSICFIVLSMAVFMILLATKSIKKLQNNSSEA